MAKKSSFDLGAIWEDLTKRFSWDYVPAKRNTAPSTGESKGITNAAPGSFGTVYKNDPITDTGNLSDQEKVNDSLFLRAPIRTQYEIDDYLQSIRYAEMRQFPNRTRLYDIYTHMLLDGHLTGVINKRILSVINQQIYYQDANGEEVEEMRDVIKSTKFHTLMRMIMETLFWGITGIEFKIGDTLDFRPIPRKHIKTKTQLISIEQNDQTTGYDYTKIPNVWVIGEPEDLGLLLQCSQYVIYKRGALADWANFIEVFGMPVRVVKYNPFEVGTEAKLNAELNKDGNLLYVMIPNTATFEMLDGKSGNANGDLQHTFVKSLNDEMSVIVLGNQETTGNSGTGSQAKSKTHSDQQKEILKADLAYLENMLNEPHFINILASYGLPVADGGRFNIKNEIDISYAIQKIEIDTALSAAGLPISEEYFYETYDIPKPSPTDTVLKAPAPANPKGQDGIDLEDNDVMGKVRISLIDKMLEKKLNDFFDPAR